MKEQVIESLTVSSGHFLNPIPNLGYHIYTSLTPEIVSPFDPEFWSRGLRTDFWSKNWCGSWTNRKTSD